MASDLSFFLRIFANDCLDLKRCMPFHVIISLQEQTMTKVFTIVLLTLGFAALAQTTPGPVEYKPRDTRPCPRTTKWCIKCTSLFGCYTCCEATSRGDDCVDCDSDTGLCTYECCEIRDDKFCGVKSIKDYLDRL